MQKEPSPTDKVDFILEKEYLINIETALLNILEDFNEEKTNMENTQRGVLNILEDFNEEKTNMENTQRGVLNILEDFNEEKTNMENTQRGVLNILEDFNEEKTNLENTQRGVLNILEDFNEETNKVESVNNNLISANKELEQFAYVASHDLQEPLRTISNFVKLLAEKYSGKTDEETELYIRFIVTATSKMQNLIKGLLDFSRVGRDVLFVAVDCNKVLEDVIAEMGAVIKENNAKISSSVLPVLTGNEIELKRLFQNLISNAIKFHKKNINPEIEISVEEKKAEYLFAFRDNGIGIEAQYFKKLFIIFQRLHNDTEYEGTGIGLATCKKIVTLHNGKIWVESKFGEGSTFCFTAPKR